MSEKNIRQLLDENQRLKDELARMHSERSTHHLPASDRNPRDIHFRQLAEHIEDAFWIVSPDWSTLHYISCKN